MATHRNGNPGKRPATHLEPAERDRLIALAEGNPRDHAILALYCLAGLRRNELRMLDRSDIDFGRKLVDVRFAKGGKYRQVPLHPRVIAALRAYLAMRADDLPLLFVSRQGGRLGLETLRQVLAKYVALADFGRPVRLHSLRHTCLTAVYQSTNDLMITKEIAGHSDIRTTAIYVHMGNDAKRRAIDAQ